MSGQVGSARTAVDYQGTSHNVLGGLTFEASEDLDVSFDFVWTAAEAALDSFDFDVPAEFLAANPNMAYDFTRTYLHSDLDVSRVELGVSASYSINDRLALTGGYRYLDYQDDAPYLGDDTGSADYYRLGIAWSF